MQTKLTLRLEDELIKQAKIKAKEQGKSLSQIVADYFKLLSQKPSSSSTLPPITESLVGIIDEAKLDIVDIVDIVGIEDYKKHLEDKYL